MGAHQMLRSYWAEIEKITGWSLVSYDLNYAVYRTPDTDGRDGPHYHTIFPYERDALVDHHHEYYIPR